MVSFVVSFQHIIVVLFKIHGLKSPVPVIQAGLFSNQCWRFIMWHLLRALGEDKAFVLPPIAAGGDGEADPRWPPLLTSSPAGWHEPSRAASRPGHSGGARAESDQRGEGHPDGQHQQGAGEGRPAGRPDREVRRPAGFSKCWSTPPRPTRMLLGV